MRGMSYVSLNFWMLTDLSLHRFLKAARPVCSVPSAPSYCKKGGRQCVHLPNRAKEAVPKEDTKTTTESAFI